MDYQAITALMDRMKENGLTLVELEEGGLRIRLEKYPQGRPADTAGAGNLAEGGMYAGAGNGIGAAGGTPPEGGMYAGAGSGSAVEGGMYAGNGTGAAGGNTAEGGNGQAQEGEIAGSTRIQEPCQEIYSPMVGTVYLSPSPGAQEFVAVGDRIVKGQQVCIIEAMKLMNEIESEIEGELMEILVENGGMVEYGQPLFRVK